MKQDYLLSIIKLDGQKITRDLKEKIGTWKEVACVLEGIGYRKSYHTIKNWKYGEFKPSLKIILDLCVYLNRDYFDYLPYYFGDLLFLHKRIEFYKLNQIKRDDNWKRRVIRY